MRYCCEALLITLLAAEAYPTKTTTTFDVRNFGAKGDNVTDDTRAFEVVTLRPVFFANGAGCRIQAAIAAARSARLVNAGVSTVLVPAGGVPRA